MMAKNTATICVSVFTLTKDEIFRLLDRSASIAFLAGVPSGAALLFLWQKFIV